MFATGKEHTFTCAVSNQTYTNWTVSEKILQDTNALAYSDDDNKVL